ncbi:MAG: EI24 domain-containing protein [Pseudomonadota bacterium]
MIGDFARAISQALDRRFLGVLLKSLALTVVLLAGLTGLALFLLGFIPSVAFTIPLVGYEVTFFDELAASLGIGLILTMSIFLMFPVAAIFVGFLLDEIADAVEAKHYPDLPPARKQTMGEVLTHAGEFALVLIGANLLALILYFFVPFIFWIVNGYLIGREYFEITAYRRLEEREAKALRRKNFFEVWLAGVLVAIPLSVPILNIIAPLIGVAAFVHLFHRKRGRSAASAPSVVQR